MMTDAQLADLRKGQSIEHHEDGSPVDPLLSVLAELVVQTTRIADNTGKPDVHLNRVDVERAWDSTGMRLHRDIFLEALKALGIKVDE